MKKFYLFCLALLTLTGSAIAAGIPVSGGGDILAAIDGAAAGDTIVLEDGGNYVISSNLALSKTIIIAAADGYQVKPKITFSAQVNTSAANGAGITFQGVDIEGPGESSFFMVIGGEDSLSHVKFYDTDLHNFGRSVIRSSEGGALDTLIVENSHLYDFTSDGWRVFWLRHNYIRYVSLKNSTFHAFTESVLYLEGDDPSETNVVIDHCTFDGKTEIDDNSIFKIYGSMGGYLKVTNSIFTNMESNSKLFDVEETYTDSISNCRFYFEGNTIDTANAWNFKSEFIAADPMYENPEYNNFNVQNPDFLTASTTGGLIGDPNPVFQSGFPAMKYEAEDYNDASGAKAESNEERSGGGNVGFIENGTWIKFNKFVFNGTEFQVKIAAASNTEGGNVEFRLDAVDGELISTVTIPSTSGWGNYITVTADFDAAAGSRDLYLVFVGEGGYLFNIDYFTIVSTEPVEPGLSEDATLSEILVDGSPLSLETGVYEYTVQLPFGVADVPTVEVVASHNEAVAVVAPAATLSEATTIVVTAQDGETELTYTISFEILPDLKTILFVGSSGNADDEVLVDSLKQFGQGYNVVFVDQAAFASEYTDATAYEDYDLLFISESISSGNSNAYGLAGFPISAFIAEPYILNKANVLLGEVTSSAQQDVLPRMLINDGAHPITSGIYETGQEVQTLNDDAEVWQYEVSINTGVLYHALGSPSLDVAVDPSIYTGGPSWLLINDNQIISAEPYIEIPEGVEMIVHAFHSGSATQSTPEYMKQVRRSVQYLLDDLPTGGPLAVDGNAIGNKLNLYPNPSNGQVALDYTLARPGRINLSFFDLNGSLVKTFELGMLQAGKNTATFTLSDLPAGLYIYKLQNGDQLEVGRLVKID